MIFYNLSKNFKIDYSVAPRVQSKIYEFIIKEDFSKDVLTALKTYTPMGFRTAEGENSSYKSLSLVYNKNITDVDPIYSTLGSSKIPNNKQYYGSKELSESLGLKENSYYDTYGFNTRTDVSRIGKLSDFIDSFKRTLIRSRISVIPANDINTTKFSYLWHRDETVFENLRFNIPIQTSDNYLFQLEDKIIRPSPQSPTMITKHLEVGKAYSWDTNKPHRVFANRVGSVDRIHIVLGFSPWFDYDEETNSWAPNEFFNKKHPHDMLIDGDIIPSKYIEYLE